jgi:hypothetical protein
VLARGIIFLDLAVAQLAVLGVVAAHALGLAADGWPTQLAAASAALIGAALLAGCERRWPQIQEALIGSTFVVAASAAVLLLAGDPHGGEHLAELLTGQILWATPTQAIQIAVLYSALLVLMAWRGAPGRTRFLSGVCAGDYRIGAVGGSLSGVRQPGSGAGSSRAGTPGCLPAGAARWPMRQGWQRPRCMTGRPAPRSSSPSLRPPCLPAASRLLPQFVSDSIRHWFSIPARAYPVALPFFKKGKDKTPSPAQKAAPACRRIAAHRNPADHGDGMGSGIVVEETSGAPQSPVDEAAILYASGQSDMAERLLTNILPKGDRRAWHMLFDLYAIQNREKEFERLALAYAMRFETSPPVWEKMGENAAAGKPQQAEPAWNFGLSTRTRSRPARSALPPPPKVMWCGSVLAHAMVDEAGADECARSSPPHAKPSASCGSAVSTG